MSDRRFGRWRMTAPDRRARSCPWNWRRAHAAAGRHRPDGQAFSPSTAAPIRIASSGIGRSSSSEGRPWGGSNGVAIDRDGKSVWATDRCSPGTAPGCLGSKANPVHHFDESGKEIRSFGGGMFVWPHGIHVDRDGNVWVTDARAAEPRRAQEVSRRRQQGKRRRQVQSRRQGPDDAGETGRARQSSRSADRPDRRRDRPGNGDVYVAESHTDVTDPESGRAHLGVRQERQVPQGHRQDRNRAGRVPDAARARVRFTRGRLIVADRHNHRIPDPEGREGAPDRPVQTTSAAPAGWPSTATTSSTRPTRSRPNGCTRAGRGASGSACSRTGR